MTGRWSQEEETGMNTTSLCEQKGINQDNKLLGER